MLTHKKFGLHLRLIDNLASVVDKALRLHLRTFQCFLIQQDTGKLITPSAASIKKFRMIREEYFDDMYVHISYFANACDPHGIHILRRELALAQRLGFTAAVLHPGSGKWCKDKRYGMDALAATLNILNDEGALPIMLENAAHAAYSVGGDIADFMYIAQQLRSPEQLHVCIDTAHAYVYGYDLAQSEGQRQFFDILEKSVGFDRIALIHLNDTRKKLGSCIDQHEAIGRGIIGAEALRSFVLNKNIEHVPVIMELPPMEEGAEVSIYDEIKQWFV